MSDGTAGTAGVTSKAIPRDYPATFRKEEEGPLAKDDKAMHKQLFDRLETTQSMPRTWFMTLKTSQTHSKHVQYIRIPGPKMGPNGPKMVKTGSKWLKTTQNMS